MTGLLFAASSCSESEDSNQNTNAASPGPADQTTTDASAPTGRQDAGGASDVSISAEDVAIPETLGPQRTNAIGASCWVDRDCPQDSHCWSPLDGFPGGYCIIEGCTEASCPTGSQCLKFTNGKTRCVDSCADSTECRQNEGYECDAKSKMCWPGDGLVPPGGSCVDDTQCMGGDNAVCIKQPGFIGGFCLIGACTDKSCPVGSKCVAQLLTSGAAACLPSCTSDNECRKGYACITDSKSKWFGACYPGCTSDASCPGDFACRAGTNGAKTCTFVPPVCSKAHPQGDCAKGSVCESGTCSPFSCKDTLLEPNNTKDTAAPLTSQDKSGFQICSKDHDWYSFTPSETDKVYVVGTSANAASGQIVSSLVFPDGKARDDASLTPDMYQAGQPFGPLNDQVHSILGAPGSDTLYLDVFGYRDAVNNYGLIARTIPWKDGPRCEALFSAGDCRAEDASGNSDPSKLIVLPLGNSKDPFIGDGIDLRNGLTNGGQGFTPTSRLYGRREVLMILRNALHEVQQAFPGTAPYGIGDIGMADGSTPNGHPNGTHYEGANVDIAYFTVNTAEHPALGNMTYRQICCDAAIDDWSCVCTDEKDPCAKTDWGTCKAGSDKTHIVDLPRTAMLIAKIAGSGRLRAMGIEAKIKPSIVAALTDLVAQGKVSETEKSKASLVMQSAEDHGSWVWHFNHLHASFCMNDADCPTRITSTPTVRALLPHRPLAEQTQMIRTFYRNHTHR